MRSTEVRLPVLVDVKARFFQCSDVYNPIRNLKVFLIGYVDVAGFNVGDEKPPHD